jgi:hypothetical protein
MQKNQGLLLGKKLLMIIGSFIRIISHFGIIACGLILTYTMTSEYSHRTEHYYLIERVEEIVNQKEQDRVVSEIVNKYDATLITSNNSISTIKYHIGGVKLNNKESWVECSKSNEDGDPAIFSYSDPRNPDEDDSYPLLSEESKRHYLSFCNNMARKIMNDTEIFKDGSRASEKELEPSKLNTI